MTESRDPDDKLIVLATFATGAEAHCLRVELENRGIRAVVANENSATFLGASWYGPLSSCWVEVLVFESDAEAALEVKLNIFPEESEELIPEWKCSCGETVDAGFEVCWSCSSPYPGLT